MARLIFKCPFLKGGRRNAPHLQNYVRYAATRDGARRPELPDQPATEKQQELVAQVVHDFPLSKALFEYADYLASPTQANASEFISRALEDNLDMGPPRKPSEAGCVGKGGARERTQFSAIPRAWPETELSGLCDDAAKRENYTQYIAQRPRAERRGDHALFTGGGGPIVLATVAEEVANHPGNVWLPIISLRREDAARLGYDSADGRSGYLNKAGIAEIKHTLANEIFRQELVSVYQDQTKRRDELTAIRKSRLKRACLLEGDPRQKQRKACEEDSPR